MSRPVKNRATTAPYIKDDAVEPLKGLVSGVDAEIARYFNDFLVGQDYAAADWTITTVEAGGGSASEAISASERSGALVITNDSNDTDSDQLQGLELYQLQTGKRSVVKAKFKVSEALDSAFLFGLCILDTTLLAGLSDGWYFRKDDADNTLKAVTEKNTNESTLDIVEMVDDTYVEVAMAWDGKNNIEVFLNVSGDWTSIGVLNTVANHPTDEALAVSIALLNGNAVANTATLDYIEVIQER